MKVNKKILMSIIAGICTVTGILTAAGCKNNSETEKITYSFNVMGGASMEEVALEIGAEYTLPQPAAREGYSFEGWYLNENFEGEPVTSVIAEANQTYYAKWIQLSKIVLQLDGEQKVVYAKKGEKLYDALQAHIPEKSGLTFGAWFSNGNVLDADATVPQGELTLTPKYKVAYTVEIYLQNMEGTAYELSVQDTIVGSEYVGTNFLSSQEKVGFKENTQHPDRVVVKALSATASENVFKHYFDRQTYSVTFVPNHPDGTKAENVVVKKKFGDNIYMPNDNQAEGYCLIGWSRLPGAVTPDFNAYFVDTVLQNVADFEPRESDYFVPTANDSENVRLYGVWAKGRVDMFGGNDYIYLFEEEGEKVVYLSRGNVYFKGEYDDAYNEFFFYSEETGDIILNGKFYSDNTFAYYSEKRSGYIAYLYSIGQGIEETTQIVFDNANGITYKVQGQQDTIGTQKTGKNGEFVADFTAATEGYMKGKTVTFVTGTYDKRNAFILLNEDERNLGTLKRFYYNQAQNSILTYQNGFGDITLDGYGVATYKSSNGSSRYYYTYEDGVITLLSQYGGLFGTAIVTTIKGEVGYVLYTKWQDATLNVQGGGTLELDGGLNAVYTKDSKVFEGYYSTINSNFGGYIIKMTTPENEQYTFMITGELDDDGVLKTGYKVTTLCNSYGEYRYLSDGMVYNAALLVIDEKQQNYLSVYGFDTRANSFVKVSDGKYQKSEPEGYYLYEVENRYSCENIITTPIDPSKVKSFVFALDSKTTAYNIFYWESMVTNDGTETKYVETYTCATETEDTSLKLVGGFAYYTLNGVTYSGAYVKYDTEGYLMILTSDATGSKTYYVEVDDDNKKFYPLDYEPYKAYLYGADGKISNTESNSIYLDFDGKGNASYVVNGETPVLGTVQETGEKTNGAVIYQFTSKDNALTFKYLIGTVGSTRNFIQYNGAYVGQYENVEGRLNLDGYGHYGQYRDANENVFEGSYLVEKENVIVLQDTHTGKRFYFDIKGREFTVRSEEYGSYLWIENQNWIQETYFELDGYGKLLVYTLEEVTNEDEVMYKRHYIDENGTYTKQGDVFTLVWADGTKQLRGELGTYYNSKAFLVKLEKESGLIGLYVNAEDWSVLILDDIGNAIKYGDEGEKEVGRYTLITESLLYYVNATNTDACIYVYDVENHTATQVKFDKTRYLTEDMETLTFYEYGYLVTIDKDGNDERYYYYQDKATDTIKIYISEPDNDLANDYGFVTQTLEGGYKDLLSFGEKSYYKNDGNTLRFTRKEASKDDYPVAISGTDMHSFDLLTFEASSDVEFNVEGKIGYNGDYMDCVVIREIDGLGQEKTYVIVGDYRFYVEFTYKGLDALGRTESEYAIVGMELYQTAYAYNFLENYAYYAGFGYAINNTLGEITVHGSYKVDGTIENFYVDAVFFKDSVVKDSEGTLIEFKDAPYTYNGEYHSATFIAKDGDTYSLHFALGRHRLGVYAFNVIALSRLQTFKYGNFEVLTERVISTELIRYEKGDLFNLTVQENGKDLGGEPIRSNDLIQFVDGKILYVVRTKDGDKYTGATYYEITLESEVSVDSVEGETTVPLYKDVIVKKSNMTVTQIIYSDNGKYFVDFTDNGVLVIALVNETFIASETVVLPENEVPNSHLPTDGATIEKAYIVTTSANGRRFIVQIRSKTVDGQEITYVYVQEIQDEI